MVAIETPIQITDEGVMYDVPIDDNIETLFDDLPIEHQYWRRQTDFIINKNFPNIFFDYNPHLSDRERCRINAKKTNYEGNRLVSLSVEDTIELTRLIKREKDRMTYGIYIMNNGKKLYFPGVYYGVLQWCKMFGQKGNDGYGEHRRYQRNLAYVHDKAVTCDLLDGYYCHKAKKTGITMEVTLFILVSTIINKQFTSAAMSKVFDTAKRANFKYYMYAVKGLPDVLRPKTESKSWHKAVQKLEFKCAEPEFSAESMFTVVSTTVDGLDGLPPIQITHIDEPPKFPSVAPINEVYDKSKEQARLQDVKVGIIIMTSYPPETDTEAFKWCREFYYECCKLDPETKLPINRMIAIFIGVTESSSGTFDKYGEPDRAKALQAELKSRETKCNNDAQLQSRQRQYPITAKEGWQSGGSGSVYNNIILTEQEAILEEMLLHGARNYIEGNLEWTAGRFSAVRFVPLTPEEIMNGKTGKWRFFIGDGNIDVLKDWFSKNTNLCFKEPKRIRFLNGERHFLLKPTDAVTAVGGVDPVDYRQITDMGKVRSHNSSVTLDIEGNLICVYYDRDEDPDVNLDELCMEIVFLSKYTLVEANKGVAYTTLDKEGLIYFLLVKYPNGDIKPFGEKSKIKAISSSGDVIKTYITLVTKRIKNEPYKLKDIRIVKQHKDFEAANTQKYDLSVAHGLAEVALDNMQTWVISKKSKFGKYDNVKDVAAAVL